MKRRRFVQGVIAAGALGALPRPRWLTARARAARQVERLAEGWRFLLDDAAGAEQPGFDDSSWERAVLPHTARIEALVTGPKGSATAQWQGTCWYRRPLRIEAAPNEEKVFLKFDGAMNIADVWIDGQPVGRHLGGYLPFVFDVTEQLTPGRDHVLAVRLDNRDNPVTGPKPLEHLDYNMYHGLYRHVHLIRKHALHITDPLFANRPASGGIFVTYPSVSREVATVRVQAHVHNDSGRAQSFRVRATLAAPNGRTAASRLSQTVELRPGSSGDVVADLEVKQPALWSITTPNLHALTVEVVTAAGVTDVETARIGIRHIEISPRGFAINGEQLFLRGTNRHQEYPYIGYALSDAAQYRDARRIKDAGFDYIRLSHYAHAPAFMSACDELGIVVMNCIPGWQYFNRDPAFVELQYRNCRDLIRRDRNHPCVIMWEVSLNESDMPAEFVTRTHAIAHEEYPGTQCYTAGWVKGYDVFIQARQHGGCRQEKDGVCVVSEYGDWEYYAMNAGLNQHAWQQLSPAESNSRQLRWQGERALLQQAANFQEAHNDNRATIAFADGLWVMYDYNRGYAPDIESSGCVDIFRLPKFSYYFFQSQRSAAEKLPAARSGPMVFIASYWTAQSAPRVRVFSNCDEVALYRNGTLLERRRPDQDRMSTQLAQPPFTFDTGGFAAGRLEAVGYIGGREAARHALATPGDVARVRLAFDTAGRGPDAALRDYIFCRAALEDASGTLVPDAWHNVAFGVRGPAQLIGLNPLATEAGMASILAETHGGTQPVSIYALALVPQPDGRTRIVAAAATLDGTPASAYEVRYTTDGTVPAATSKLYDDPINSTGLIRAALLADKHVVVLLASDAPKFRIPPSAAPDARTEFE